MHVSQQFDVPSVAAGMKSMPGASPSKLAVAGVDSLPRRHPLRQHRQLRPADRGQEVAEAVVEADLGVLVVRYGLARLRRELARVRDERVVAARPAPRHRSS